MPADLSEYRKQLDKVGTDLTAARRREKLTRAKLRDLVVKAVGAGVSEVEASKLAGITRVTVREWLGK